MSKPELVRDILPRVLADLLAKIRPAAVKRPKPTRKPSTSRIS